jgi:hypothetical protein
MKSNRLGTAIAFVVAMLVGCGNCADDVRTLCDAPLRARPGAGAAEITVAFNQAYERVRSKKGKELVERIQGVERPEKARIFRAAATEQGLASCAMADKWLEQAAAAEEALKQLRQNGGK